MNFPKRSLFVAVMLFSMTLTSQNKAARLANIMKTYHDYNMFDGAVLVAENGKVVYKGAFGLANRDWVTVSLKIGRPEPAFGEGVAGTGF